MNRKSALQKIPIPLPTAGVLALTFLYCMLGLVGHSPWKTEDAVGVGIVFQMLTSDHLSFWLVPRLAGELYLDDGPLFYVLAAICAKILAPLLALHDGARLASALSLGATIWFCRAATTEFFGRQEGDSAALMLIGCLGLFVHAHMVDGENGALAGSALAWYGLALAIKSNRRAPWVFGAGLLLVFLTKGLPPMLPPLVAAFAAPLLGEQWRTRRYAAGLLVALAATAAGVAAWLVILDTTGPHSISAWWLQQVDLHASPVPERLREQVQLLSWATWPLWPVALWALWDRRRRLKSDPCLVIAVGALAGLALFLATRNVSEILAKPIMMPLAILAGAGFTQLRRGAANAILWFGAMTFTILGGLVWLGWIAMMTGVPAQIANNFAKLEPGHVPRFDGPGFAIAVALTLLWLAIIGRSARSPLKGAPVWAVGVTLVWGLVMSLWVHWIDYGKTYEPVALSLKAAIPANTRCISGRNLGEAQRAAFHYHSGIVTQRLEIHPKARCDAILIQGVGSRPDRLEAGWHRVWEGSRPRERERFRLYVRD